MAASDSDAPLSFASASDWSNDSHADLSDDSFSTSSRSSLHSSSVASTQHGGSGSCATAHGGRHRHVFRSEFKPTRLTAGALRLHNASLPGKPFYYEPMTVQAAIEYQERTDERDRQRVREDQRVLAERRSHPARGGQAPMGWTGWGSGWPSRPILSDAWYRVQHDDAFSSPRPWGAWGTRGPISPSYSPNSSDSEPDHERRRDHHERRRDQEHRREHDWRYPSAPSPEAARQERWNREAGGDGCMWFRKGRYAQPESILGPNPLTRALLETPPNFFPGSGGSSKRRAICVAGAWTTDPRSGHLHLPDPTLSRPGLLTLPCPTIPELSLLHMFARRPSSRGRLDH